MELEVVTLTPNPALDVTAEVEELVPFRKVRAERVRREPGGGGINVARVLDRSQAAVRAVFPAGGLSGAELVAAVAREGVPMEVIDSAAPTRESITLWERSGGAHYRILVAGEPLAESAWRACLDAVRAAPPPRWVVLSGSLPLGLPAAVVTEAAETARERGARFACDSAGAALAAAVEAGADLVSPNRRELRELIDPDAEPERFDHEAAARRLVRRGVGAVVVSLGEDGAFVTSSDGLERRLRSPPIEVVSTVGAGDSLLAGVIAGLLRGEPLETAVARGVATGAATCLEHGSELAQPSTVDALLEAAPASRSSRGRRRDGNAAGAGRTGSQDVRPR